MEKKMYYIYEITNLINGKNYIGQHRYKTLDDNYMGSGRYLAKAKKKYGINNFTKTIIEYGIDTKEKADIREVFWISEYKKQGKAEYNIAAGGYKSPFEYETKEAKIERGRKVSLSCRKSHNTDKRFDFVARFSERPNEDDVKTFAQCFINRGEMFLVEVWQCLKTGDWFMAPKKNATPNMEKINVSGLRFCSLDEESEALRGLRSMKSLVRSKRLT